MASPNLFPTVKSLEPYASVTEADETEFRNHNGAMPSTGEVQRLRGQVLATGKACFTTQVPEGAEPGTTITVTSPYTNNRVEVEVPARAGGALQAWLRG